MNEKDIIINEKTSKYMINSTIFEETSDFQTLKEQLEKYGKLTVADNKVLNIPLEVINRLIIEAQKEWTYEYNLARIKKEDEEIQICMLCGQKGIKNLHYVKNKYVNPEIVWLIGSSCAAEFGEGISKAAIDKIKEFKRISAINEIQRSIPQLKPYLEENKNFSKHENTIPNKLYEAKNIHLKNLSKAYEQYINNPSTNLLKSISLNLEDSTEIDKYIADYHKDNQDNLFYPTQEIKKWISKHSSIDLERSIRSDGGLISKKLYHQIGEHDFIIKMIKKIQSFYSELLNINMGGEITKRVVYSFKSWNQHLKLSAETSEFLKIFSRCLFEEASETNDTIKSELILDAGSVLYDPPHYIFRSLKNNFNSIGYEILIIKDLEKQLILKKNNMYHIYNGIDFAKYIYPYLFNFNNSGPRDNELITVLEKSSIRELDEQKWANYLDNEKELASDRKKSTKNSGF